jgi:hypothetical protein
VDPWEAFLLAWLGVFILATLAYVSGEVMANPGLSPAGGLGVRDDNYATPAPNGFYQPQLPNPEEVIRQAHEAVQAQQARADEAEQADKKAKKLLAENLDHTQLASLYANGYFQVRGNRTQRYYRIRSGQTGNVSSENGKRYCANLGVYTHDRLCAYYAKGDVMLAQKIMIENDELEFLRVANDMGEAAPFQPE